MESNAPPVDRSLPVSGSGRAWWAYSAYVVFALGVALVAVTVYLVITSPGLFSIDLPGALLGIAAFLMGLAILDRLPRNVVISPDAIEFRYLLSHVRLKWEQLAPPALVGEGFVAFRGVTGTRGVWGPLTVTVGQAKEILAYPSCPTFDLQGEIAKELRPSA